MERKVGYSTVASVLALLACENAYAQTEAQGAAPQAQETQQDVDDAIVVTGIRRSLERAADIKRDSVQVVDAIVAQDIGKLPDPTTAAALQRVPGVQVSINRNNELGGVRVRGLPDVLTTVNGREVFTTVGRNFDLQDMPAEALSRVNVFKSQTAELTEGGLAGVIDLQLNRPFNFTDPTIVLGARANYGDRVDKINPQVSLLATDRWDTGIGEIGALINGTYSKSDYYRAQTALFQRRSSATAPFNRPGLLLPNILQNFPEQGYVERHQVNGALQWEASPSLQAYVEGFYTYFRDRGSHVGANIQPYTTGTTITDVSVSDRCILTRARNNNGNNPVIQTDATGKETLTPYSRQTLCEPDSITFANLVSNQTTQARDLNQRNKQIAGGVKYEENGLRAVFDVAYQTSKFALQNVTTAVGQRIGSMTVTLDADGHAEYLVPGDELQSPANLSMRNQLVQTFTRNKGDLFQVKGDVDYELGGFLSNIAGGIRYARRSAEEQSVVLNTPVPGGNLGTPSEAQAVLVSNTGLPSEYVALGPVAPDLNGGARFYVPNPDFLLSESGLDQTRAYFGLPPGQPDFEPGRQFDATERTIAGYLQGKYEAELSNNVLLDGVVGARYIRTSRSIGTFVPAGGGLFDRLTAKTTDHDWLPNATARVRIGDDIQIRLGYAKSLRRPNFEALNPAITLNQSNNALVQSTGSAGNPDLKAQKSQSLDATFEYYFGSGYIALAGYYRDITDRVISSAAIETYDGIDYSVSRPRNVGQATLKGVELSAQYFLDFLPGALSGLGVQGAFTIADSKVGGDDPLAGYPLQGVSKYNYTVGLLYEKSGISARLVYTYRSKYFDTDETGSPTLRPFTEENIDTVEVPPLIAYQRAAGRLDFNIGYDVTERLRIDVGGTNILGSNSRSYFDYPGYNNINNSIDYNETTYSLGLRLRI